MQIKIHYWLLFYAQEHLFPHRRNNLSALFQHDDYMFSRVLTLDLSQYPDTEGQESRPRESR